MAIHTAWGPKEVKVNDQGQVTGIVFKKCLRTIDPETKRFSPAYDESVTMEVPADRIVFAIGQAIEWGGLLDGAGVEFWHGNYPVADKLTYQTAQEDIFVGGDVYTGPRFVIDAIAAGHEAAESLHRFVRPRASMTIGRDRRTYIPLNKEDLTYPSYDRAGRQEPGGEARRGGAVLHRRPRDPHRGADQGRDRPVPELRRVLCGPQQVHRLRPLHHPV